ncbi:endonuclease/exonuclease/phosphatase family protein [Nocardioides sp. KIGAM211]|uniref:Endonuclease/exonuclease/phosphatase family protein n=1 Tax=Nocardioides luti TaxID=2761101 RepID=A0A7X0RE96_9ACTN|nr:endonuclease/exonuclease/phosphatase family protein [Nocardioides luti]MBB6626694.1 endonuclease/exonuclease/phosphatase family protein [Nocardioides luti]
MRARGVVLGLAALVVLAPAAFLTVVRATDPGSGRLIRAESFTPLALPAYAVVLVVALLVLVLARRRGGGRGRGVAGAGPALVALVALVGLVLHAVWFAPRLLGANPPPADGARTLVVMTANLYAGHADGIELVRTASEEDVDVLVVEEVTTEELADMEAAGLADLFPFRIGEAHALDADGTMVFSRTLLGTAEPVDTGHESWLVRVTDPDVGDALTLLVVHPYAPTEPAQWRADHAAIRAAVEDADPDLVVGDFNATLDHPPMRALGDLGLRSVAELANEGWQPTWPSNGIRGLLGVGLPPLVQIDHVLVGRRLAALGTHTVDVPGTDHRAVVAEVARK